MSKHVAPTPNKFVYTVANLPLGFVEPDKEVRHSMEAQHKSTVRRLFRAARSVPHLEHSMPFGVLPVTAGEYSMIIVREHQERRHKANE